MQAANILTLLTLVTLGGVGCAREKPEVIKHDNGLTVTILKKSKDCIQRAKRGDVLKITFIGRHGGPRGQVFEETKPGKYYNFKLGVGHVIAGYDYGVPGMCVGEKRALTVPPHLAYGGKAVLHFTIKLVEITEEGPPLEEQTPPPPPPPSKEGQKEEL